MKKTFSRGFDLKTAVVLLAGIFFFVLIHHYILFLQNDYRLEIGPGDKDYYTVNRQQEFGLPESGEWVRDMRKRSFVLLPYRIRGESVRLGFEIKSYARQEKVSISNVNKEVIGSFNVPAVTNFAIYEITLNSSSLPGNRIDIKIYNGTNPAKELDLQLNRIFIHTNGGGTALPWIYDLYFIIAVCGFFIVLLFAGFNIFQSGIGAAALSILLIFARFMDVISYIAYLRVFLIPGLPFLFISVLIICLLHRRSRLFKDEKLRIISMIFIFGFLVHFIGLMYPYHMNKDGRLRVSFFRLMEREGVGGFVDEMSRQHSAATGPENAGIPYPPWYNIIARPFVKMGIEDQIWLKFQCLMIGSFYLILIYALARRFGLTAPAARLASFLSIFGTGILRDLVYFVYDPKLAFILMLLFIVYLFKKIEKLPEMTLKECLIPGIMLGLVLVLHPDSLLCMGMLLFIFFIMSVFVKYDRKLYCLRNHAIIGIVGLSLSIVLFYWRFIWSFLKVTLPNALAVKSVPAAKAASDAGNYSILKALFFRSANTMPLIFIPFFIYGMVMLYQKFKKDGFNRTSLLCSSWIIAYLIFFLLWLFRVFFNFLKYFPEYNFIYPLVFPALGFAFTDLIKRFNDKPIIKYSLIGVIAVSVLLEAVWFYIVQIRMAPSFSFPIDVLNMLL